MESYRNTKFIVLKEMNSESSSEYIRVHITGGCLNHKDDKGWFYTLEATYVRNLSFLQSNPICNPSERNEWYLKEKAVIWDPLGIGKIHAAAGSDYERVLSTFNVGSANPQFGQVYINMDKKELKSIESAGYMGKVKLQSQLDSASANRWRAFFREKSKESSSTNFVLSVVGLASTSVSAVGAVLSSTDWFSNLENVDRVAASDMVHLIAQGGTFINIHKVRRDLLMNPYLYSDLCYEVNVGAERRFTCYIHRDMH